MKSKSRRKETSEQMEVKVDKIIHEKASINIVGVTLLLAEEAEKLPDRLREYDCWWWLRSSGHSQSYVAGVYRDGSVYYYGVGVDNVRGCIRPALRISTLESSDLQIGDRFEFGDVEFEVVSNDTAFCIADLGRCAFRYTGWLATDANDYEASDIKKFVDNWFTNAVRAAAV